MSFQGSRADIKIRAVLDTEEAKGSLAGFMKSLNEGAAGFKAFGAAASEAWEMVSEGPKQFMALAAAGDRYGDVLKHLKIDISGATEALHGQVGEMDLMLAANSATLAGLKLTSEQFADIAKVGKQFADATGGDAADAINRLTMAMVTGRERALRPFGIQAGDLTSRLTQLAAKAKTVDVEIGGVTDATDALSARWETFTLKLGQSMDENGPITNLITNLADIVGWLNKTPGAAEAAGEAMTAALLPLYGPLDHVGRGFDHILESLRGIRAAANGTEGWDDTDPDVTWLPGGRPPQGFPRLANTTAETPAQRRARLAFEAAADAMGPEEDRSNAERANAAAQAAAQRRREEDERRRQAQRGASGGRSGGNQTPLPRGDFYFSGPAAETLEDFDARQAAREAEMEATIRFQDRQTEMSEQAFQRRMERNRMESDAERTAMEQRWAYLDEEEQINKRRTQAAFASASGIIAISNQLVSGLSGSKSLSMFLTGLEEQVLAIASFAGQDYIGGGMHEAAAILAFANSAIAAGIGGSGGGRRASGAAVGGGGRSAGNIPGLGIHGSASGGQGGGQTVIYNVLVDTAGTGFVPDSASLRFHQMSQLAQERHGFHADPRKDPRV